MTAPFCRSFDLAATLGAQTEAGRAKLLYFVASKIADRWRGRGFTTFAIEDGLPIPARPHIANWDASERIPRCQVCGRACLARGARPVTCAGISPFDAISDALDRGVTFGVDPYGLPRAGLPLVHGDILPRLASATCSPVRRAA